MRKKPLISDKFTYMHNDEAAMLEYEIERFDQLVSQQSQPLSPEQTVVMALLRKVLFPHSTQEESEYSEERATQFRHLLRHYTEVAPINLKTISDTEMRAILDKFHQLISGGATNANRTFLMQNMVGDFRIKRLLHRDKGYRDSPSIYRILDNKPNSVKHQAINLRACGFPAKADICDKHISRYLYLETIISGALEEFSEEEVITTITSENGTCKLLGKLKKPDNIDLVEVKKRFETVKSSHNSGPFDYFNGIDQIRDLMPKDMPTISVGSHQRANYLITNKFTTLKEFQSWQQCLAPVYLMYAHPHMINSGFTHIVNQINLACREGQDPIRIAAWAHCKFQEFHPYEVANKRTARVLMNLVLASHNIPPQDFTTPLEIHAYTVALFHTLFHSIASENEKSQYIELAFYEFLKKKIELANDSQTWAQYLQEEFLPKHEQNLGLANDIREILADPTDQSLHELLASLQSYLDQIPLKKPQQSTTMPKVETAGVSFFTPKINYATLKITKHNASMQNQLAQVLDKVVSSLNVGTLSKEGTQKGWRVFSTSLESCYMAQVDCSTDKSQEALKTFLEAKAIKVITGKSKQNTYIVRIFFHDVKELDVLTTPGIGSSQ